MSRFIRWLPLLFEAIRAVTASLLIRGKSEELVPRPAQRQRKKPSPRLASSRKGRTR